MKYRLSLACLSLSIFCLWQPTPARADKPLPKDPVQIGMPQTMVVDVPQPLIDLLGYPFGALMKEFTGLNGKLKVGGSPFDVARNLEDGKIHLGVFQGVEFAWVQAKHPRIKPIMVALYQNKNLHAQLLVRKDSGIESFADLKNKDVAFPKKSKEHCRVFMDRHCNECGECAPRSYFGNLCQPSSIETALDQLAEGKCHAVIGDKVDVEFFCRVKPGVFNQLKIVRTSEAFPAGVICCIDGELDAKTIEQFRRGMLRANKNERGREMMGMFRITSFEHVPADYQQNLEDILRAYPGPETKVSMN